MNIHEGNNRLSQIWYLKYFKDTYGHYAELRHRAEDLVQEHHTSSGDIRAQRDYMDTVCRSFASRLERRRILLITSVRFHRLTEEVNKVSILAHQIRISIVFTHVR